MPRFLLHNLLLLLLALALGSAPAFAEEEDTLETLGLDEPTEQTLVSTSHVPRPTSKTAENITVITAEEIARLNAHTLADVLQTIPGIQLDYMRTPGSFTFFNIQGALNTTVLVMIDGVRQNDFNQNIALPGLVPVQNIERIEIVKGAASSAWGSALGGVINIITKNPNPDRMAAGTLSGSIGSRFTTDSRGELSGTTNKLGYYLSLGQLHSDGLHANTANDMNTAYGKLTLQLPKEGKLTAGFFHQNAHPGQGQEWYGTFFTHDNNKYRRTYGFLNLNQPLATNLTLDINANFSNRNDHALIGSLDSNRDVLVDFDTNIRESRRGLNSRLSWSDGRLSLVAGFEYYNTRAKSVELLSNTTYYDRRWDSWGLYANGSYSIGKLTIIPGIRHDMTGMIGDNTSYSLESTYQLAESTTMRAYYGQGFSLPTLAAADNLQKVKTFQSGIETGAVPYLWLKGTYYYNTISNSQSLAFSYSKQTRQGFELEARTVPVHNLSLAAGYTFLYAKNSDTGARLKTDSSQSVPPHLVKLSAIYNNSKLGLTGTLTGNYVYWLAAPGVTAADQGMIWNLHLNWKIRPQSELSPELFFSGHNLFNGLQTTDYELARNNRRWFEGGVRVRF